MKIRLEHASNPLNYGTNMMVINFMYYLNREMKNNNTYILDVYNDEDLNIYKKQNPELNIERETIDYNFYYSTNIIQKIKNKIKREIFFSYFNKKNLKKLQASTETLVVLGGDDISEYYGIEPLKRELNRLKDIKNIMNIILVGQTIGPFESERNSLVKSSLDGIGIFTRDPWTTEYLEKEIGLKEIITSSDLALLPLPGQENVNLNREILSKYNLEENQYITIVPSGIYDSYCDDKSCYVDNIVDIINYVKEKTKYKILLLPHVLRPAGGDDRNIIKCLQEVYGNHDDITYIYDVLNPLEARLILGNGKFTITGRMHGAVNTLHMRKPAISISYSVKYEGVIGRDLGLKELIVQAENNVLWVNKTVVKDTVEKINYVLDNYDNLVKKIDESVTKSAEKVLNTIREIANKLN